MTSTQKADTASIQVLTVKWCQRVMMKSDGAMTRNREIPRACSEKLIRN